MRKNHPIDKSGARGDRELLNGCIHCSLGSTDNTYLVDDLAPDDAYSHRLCVRHDALVKFFPDLGDEFLAIAYITTPRYVATPVRNHSSGNHRSRKRTPSGFIDACNGPEPTLQHEEFVFDGRWRSVSSHSARCRSVFGLENASSKHYVPIVHDKRLSGRDGFLGFCKCHLC